MPQFQPEQYIIGLLVLMFGAFFSILFKKQQMLGVRNIVHSREVMKMVICVRTDLGMTKGKAAAQCCHGVLEAYKQSVNKSTYLKAWESQGQAKITLKVDTEQQLFKLQKTAKKAGLVAVVIHDAGRTQILAGSPTVLVVGPGPFILLPFNPKGPVELVDSVTKDLSLY